MNYTGVVHWSTNGKPSCGTRVPGAYNHPTLASVTCAKCIRQYGSDEPGHVDVPPEIDPHIARRAAERAARQAERASTQ